MTKKELIEELLAILARNGEDPEVDHHDADVALLNYINDAEVQRAFEDIWKWYA